MNKHTSRYDHILERWIVTGYVDGREMEFVDTDKFKAIEMLNRTREAFSQKYKYEADIARLKAEVEILQSRLRAQEETDLIERLFSENRQMALAIMAQLSKELSDLNKLMAEKGDDHEDHY